MRILVLGSGVLGVSTAYVLSSRGHTVEVLDRNGASAMETSFANGGQLSYSHAEPWATPYVLKKLPKWIFHEDSPLIFRPRADLEMIKWGLKFLLNCSSWNANKNTINALKLALYSRNKMEQVIRDTGIKFDYLEKGILHLFSTEKDFAEARKQADFQSRFGCEQTIISRDEAIKIEPELEQSQRQIVGAIHSHMDQSGDAKIYCSELEEFCKTNFKTTFTYGVQVQGIEHEDGKVLGVATNMGRKTADAYVMALGSYSPIFLKPLGIHLPIYPMKGYSITIPADNFDLKTSITDGKHKIVYSRLGNRIRAAGTAEFAGYNDKLRQSRIDPIILASKTMFPQGNWSTPENWACLRPSTPDSSPFLGSTSFKNLFLNTGHGTLGWTHSAGSAYYVADVIEGKTPEIDGEGLTLKGRAKYD